MTLKPLWQDDFALASPMSARPPAAVGRDGQLIELRDELARRLKLYPGMVDRGTLKPADAERYLANWRAIVADYERDAGRDVPEHHAPWDTKVRELRRELALRRQFYPKRLAARAAELAPADAVKRLERLDAVHYAYYVELWRFTEGGQDWRDDAQLALWIAETHIRREGSAWDAAVGADSLMSDGSAGPAAAEAKRQAARWRRIRDAAALAAGVPVSATWPNREILTALHATTLTAMNAIPGYTDPHANNLAKLARWLEERMFDRRRPETGLARDPERIAA